MELHSVNGNDHLDDKSPHNTEIEVPSEADRDVQALARLGKKPILKVFYARHHPHAMDSNQSDLTTSSDDSASCPF